METSQFQLQERERGGSLKLLDESSPCLFPFSLDDGLTGTHCDVFPSLSICFWDLPEELKSRKKDEALGLPHHQ